MTKEDIIRSISEEFRISELESISFYENIFRYIEGSFRKNRNLNITDFGKFNVIEKPDNAGRKMNHVKFSPSKKLATEINYNYSNLAKILFKDIEDSMNRDRILNLGAEKPAELFAKADESTDMHNSPNEEETPEDNHENLSEVDEFLRNYTDQEKRFLQKQVVPVSGDSSDDYKKLDARITKVENFIAIIREYFENEKLGHGDESITSFRKADTTADALLKAQAETYEKNLRRLEDKVKDLETRIRPAAKDTQKEVSDETTEAPEKAPVSDFKTSEPVIKIKPESEKPEAIKSTDKEEQAPAKPEEIPSMGEAFTETEIKEAEPFTDDEKISKISDRFTEVLPEEIEHPVAKHHDELNKAAEISTTGEDVIEDKFDTAAPETAPVQKTTTQDETVEQPYITDEDPNRQKPSGRNITSDNIADLLDNIKTPSYPETGAFSIEHKDVDAVEDETLRKAEEELHPELKKEDDTDEILKKAFTEVKETKPPEPSERAGEPDVRRDDITSKYSDSSNPAYKEFERELHNQGEKEAPVKPVTPDQDDEKLSKALSSIYTSILESEKIQNDPGKPAVDEKLKDLHDEINMEKKRDDTYQPPQSFSDVFEDSVNKHSPDSGTNGHNLKDTNGHNLKDTNGHNLKDTNGHNLKDTNGHNLKDTNGHNLKDTNGHNLKEGYTNGHNLKDTNGHNLKDTNGHNLKDTNGHNLTEAGEPGYTNGKTLKENVSDSLKQNGTKINNALERNGLTTNKDSKLNAIVIVIIIIIAIALLAYGIFSAGIFGKASGKQTLLKVNDAKSEKYYFDNGKDMVFFKTDNGFTIQVGSYKQKEKAIEKKQTFEKNNLDNVRIEEVTANNEIFYRVRVGKFDSLDQAKDFSETL
ncbi:hypothetical protein BH10BAC5_BH10BAC5_22760 [soil metagenome]